MRVAVTGGLGFIGQEIVAGLIARGDAVVVVDYWEDRLAEYERNRRPILEGVYETLPKCYAVVDPWEFVREMEKYAVEVIVHAGAVVDTRNLGGSDLWLNNVKYTTQLCERAAQCKAGIVFTSSAAVYGSWGAPNNPYGLSKAMGEKIVHNLSSSYSILRLFNVFGRNEHHKGDMASVPWKLAQVYKNESSFEMHSPDASRDFVPVSGVAAVVLAETLNVRRGAYMRTLDVGTGVSTTFWDLDLYVRQALGSPIARTKMIDMPPELKGRYQGYTRAGDGGRPRAEVSISTRDGIEEAYVNVR